MHPSLFSYLLALPLFTSLLFANSATQKPVRVPPNWRQVMNHAGMIFAGRVLAITPLPSDSPDHVTTVQITVAVELGIRGARSGQQLTFHEWAGLWSSGERYRPGQRLLLFLYPPSSLGLTSPVAGPDGKLAIDAEGRIHLSEEQQQSIRKSDVPIRLNPNRTVRLRDFVGALRRIEKE